MNPNNDPFSSAPPVSDVPYRPVPTAPLPSPYTAPNAPYSSPSGTSGKPLNSGKSGVGKTVLLVFFIILSLGSLGLLGYVYFEYTDLKTDFEEKKSLAVAEAEKKLTDKLEAAFTEREKEPYLTFSGPVDYGELSFQYPKTWSVYVAEDAAKGGDFEAILNPVEVNAAGKDVINAISVTISDEAIDKVQPTYEKLVSKGSLSAEIKEINGETTTVYKGTLPSKFVGAAAVIKIRDKTAIIETDAEIFLEDFNKILESITYNK